MMPLGTMSTSPGPGLRVGSLGGETSQHVPVSKLGWVMAMNARGHEQAKGVRGEERRTK